MERFDCLYIHIKGPDEPAHDGDFNKKKASIEAIDKFFFGNLIPNITLKDTIIVVTADHSTPCELKAHSADPVPLLLYNTDEEGDSISTFGETNCIRGSLGTLTGVQVMPLLTRKINS